MADETMCVTAPARDRPDCGPQVLVNRYVLRSVIAQGGFGIVFAGYDKLTEEDVAIKLLPALTPSEIEQAQREVTALRWARLPGVVELLDEGVEGLDYFIVTRLVRGHPFPGMPTPAPWPKLAAIVTRVLEILAHVHFAGLVHRDLKPANVWVDAHGHPVLLDFGLARVPHEKIEGFEGTPAYVAPEQANVDATDHRADLYSLGVMVFEALVGKRPSQEVFLPGLPSPGPRAPVPRLATQVSAPATVARIFDRMIQWDPRDRPTSALQVLEALGAQPGIVGPLSLPTERPATVEALAALFWGPEPFFHLPTHAARTLWARTGGWAAEVRAELDAWLRAGLAHLREGRVVPHREALGRLDDGLRLQMIRSPGESDLDPDAQTLLTWIRLAWPATPLQALRRVTGLEGPAFDRALGDLLAGRLAWKLPDGRLGARLVLDAAPQWSAAQRRAAHASLVWHLPVGDPHRLTHLVASDNIEIAVLQEIEQFSRRAIVEGRYEAARPALTLGLTRARTDDDVPAQEKLLALRTLMALTQSQETRTEMEHGLYAVGRAIRRTALIVQLERLLRAAQAASGRERERAYALLNGVGTLADERLEVWHQSIRLRIAEITGLEAELDLLSSLDAWASTDERRAMWQGWLGNLRYRQSRFSEAADLHRRSAASLSSVDARLRAQLNAASAMLETRCFPDATQMALAAAETARQLKLPPLEAWAIWLTRAIAYRAARPVAPRLDLVDAAAAISPYWEGLFALNEGAIAWRRGDAEIALAQSRRALDRFRVGNLPRSHQLLAHALALAIEGSWTHSRDGEICALVAEAQRCPPPDIGAQVLGLLGHHQEARQLAGCRPPETWSARLDVLSLAEASGDIPRETWTQRPLRRMQRSQ